MKFKPLLAPNKQPELESLKYPLLAFYKLDGIRCIFKDGEMLSRSLKPIQNKQLQNKFLALRQYSKDSGIILDGEIYSPDLSFQEIVKYVMTKDFEDKKSIKKFGKVLTIPEHLSFYCFDAVDSNNYSSPFLTRFEYVMGIADKFPELISQIPASAVRDSSEVQDFFKEALKAEFEGLILRNLSGEYKCGRGTLKEGIIYKVKPFRTWDAEIKDIVQATKVDPKAEKKINELGRSVTSKKKGDRIPIEKACDFIVDYEGKDLKVVIALTDKEKKEIWKNRKEYIGKMIEYKGMVIGSKDLPRHPVFIRFREDK